MTFERTLIFPHGPLRKFLVSAKLEDAGKEIPKLYVAVTARGRVSPLLWMTIRLSRG
jgi:hypothetical protein